MAPLSSLSFITGAWLVLERKSESSDFAVVGFAVEVVWPNTAEPSGRVAGGLVRPGGPETCLGCPSRPQQAGWGAFP